jgi:fucose permease
MSVAAIQMKEELNWTDHQKGLMLSAFYWGYAIGQIPSNFLGKSNIQYAVPNRNVALNE